MSVFMCVCMCVKCCYRRRWSAWSISGEIRANHGLLKHLSVNTVDHCTQGNLQLFYSVCMCVCVCVCVYTLCADSVWLRWVRSVMSCYDSIFP